ncbi:MAG: hypothetical protein ABNH38_19800 [Tateyamaria sp.]|jgi:hypothetical protein|uniref:hypothetical protein n=1 Tax=Tateyamaria sp. TaxID=1929288 RepID=UPI0032DD93E7
MANKTQSVLAEEGKAVGTILTARKAEHNFAQFNGKDDLLLSAHKTKNKSAVRQIVYAEVFSAAIADMMSGESLSQQEFEEITKNDFDEGDA